MGVVAWAVTAAVALGASGCCRGHGSGPVAPGGGMTPRFLTARPSGAWTRFPAGVAEPGLDVAYVSAAGGGIVALELPAGGIRWRSQEADLPLLAVDGVVVAAAADPADRRRLRVVVLDAADGATRFATEPLELPRAEPMVQDVRVVDGVVHVTYLGPPVATGRRPSPELERPVTGAFTVDLGDGRIAPATPLSPPPARAVTVEERAGRRALVVQKPDGTPGGETLLPDDPSAGSVSPFLTTDGAHALVRICRSGAAPETCRWTVFAADSLARAGEIDLPADAEPPIAIAGDALYIALRQPPSVRAAALSSGATLWQQATGLPAPRRKPR